MAYNRGPSHWENQFIDITDSNEHIDDPEANGYKLLENQDSFSDDDDDDNTEEEFAVITDQRQHIGHHYDESVDVESSASSDALSYGKVESVSRSKLH